MKTFIKAKNSTNITLVDITATGFDCFADLEDCQNVTTENVKTEVGKKKHAILSKLTNSTSLLGLTLKGYDVAEKLNGSP
ncbi:ribonucleotide-diphosphate reductase alpha subunit [Pseudooceanicola batsensis HTCC2597]|uniref:Ribonucleotide-diphosphate reductase alpha subunit n=1 Tax=Pseudooceanicola batsensis (strain ATCC BAA-863 / DSM 15984 / KCTC 12145 / HTCC2597) TaxID=252305 RepID=A3U3R0_PSEBH|nr:hypothetical protein [Pseudooceanicola batsensis]EAQ01149.1 ribonucleotide-diphosphate reductase alpha subunit [Pseudooceanicola batsensis HTCC2597]